MTLVATLVAISLALSWAPFRRIFPSESFGAFVLVGIAMVALFQLGKLS